ncbi:MULTISPECIES: octaprenyl diphosphate synthase [Halomonas]|uniref:Octaprenyl diphosphate synthase n=3 Tax=Halomonas TaxID=2745 RepID=A0AAU7KG47_9GAMM|nr:MULTISPECIES: octaprenyl diphosphate synthase [Halomonas]MBR9881176.1 octaprenyl diphosphate synthase [Gammaproteobacteria bacterium]KJZ06877.1 octaprenyl diphosphate synthase [Halomonas sp. S2151]MAR71632.1 octaprenyl diphosphate synthase [Halomonas sp.]MBS8270512.1 octaprenyl diphosphate synthase [Halomonas litopenaei]MBY5942473.1 octaprenyl diphosphate synthase [Halomonas sp. DP5N14-9]|tara:strand:+ start:859 stop:1857 length:999 start_codon:yes stop_codon:yes gene_type:complete
MSVNATPSPSAAPSPIHAVVADDFAAVNQTILDQLASRIPLVETIGQYIIESGGKRLRPLLVLLAARALEYQGDRHITLATLIEFMHTSTLLHDDVVDESHMRRGKATANDAWGNAPSVLVGDFLYSRSFQMMVEVGSMRIMEVLSAATCTIAEGEVQQLTNVGNPDTDEAAYFDTILGKTAMLFEAASHSGAILAGADERQEQALALYGRYLGLAFQLVDDLLDYEGDAKAMGKNVGDDLAEGKPTLPLIQAMAAGTPDQTRLVRRAIRKGGLDHLDEVLAIVKSTGALDYTRQKAEEMAAKALAELDHLPPSPYRDSMAELARLAVERKT